MKTSKNQANAVRSYLATLGIEIGHVQALEVIARGAGDRSRHVVAPRSDRSSNESVGAVRDAFADLLELRERYWEPHSTMTPDDPIQAAESLFPGLFESTHEIEEFLEQAETVSVSTEWEAICRAGALRQAFVDAGRTPVAQAEALKALVRECDKFFSNYEEAHAFLTQFDETVKAQEHDRLGRVKYSIEDPVEYRIKPVGQVDDDGLCGQHAMRSLTRMDPDVIIIGAPHPNAEKAKADAIKAQYVRSRGHADDTAHAVARLVDECPVLFPDERQAWCFIKEFDLKDMPDTTYAVQVHTEGSEAQVHTFFTEEERRAGVIRLMAKAVDLNDCIARRYYFTDIGAGAPPGCTEYVEVLEQRKLEGEIVDSVVTYQGTRIGTIDEITEDDLTLYSWIDDNP
jgi:hypothetical protein